jgi:hypothetical protein
MNTKSRTAVSILALAVAAGPVFAQDAAAAKTREQVRAELLEAQRTGDVMADGESGMKLNELYPRNFPASASANAQSRARTEVRAELLEAQRRGDLMSFGDSESAFTQRYPGRASAASSLTRAEVKAQLLEAQRRGDWMTSDSGSSFNGVYLYRPLFRSKGRSSSE